MNTNTWIWLVCAGLLAALGRMTHAAATLVAPPEGMHMTHVATSFKVQVTGTGPFVLQVARDAGFQQGLLSRTTTTVSTHKLVYFYDRSFKLAAGVWHWRVSDNGGSTWSPSRSVTVNTDLPETPPVREISPRRPMFHNRLWSDVPNQADAAARLAIMVPPDLKDYIVLDACQSWAGFFPGKTPIDFSRSLDQAGYAFYFDLGRPDFLSGYARAVALSEVEYVLQNMKNCVGVATGELFYEYFTPNHNMHDFTHAALDLCRKYGKFFIFSDFNWRRNRWGAFAKENFQLFGEKKFGKYFIPQFKTTNVNSSHAVMGNILGMGMTGMVDNFGLWADEFSWNAYGNLGEYDKRNSGTLPYVYNIRSWLYSIALGGAVTGQEAAMVWDRSGRVNQYHANYFLPFLRAVVQHRLIPSRDSVLAHIKAAVDQDVDPNLIFDYNRDNYGQLFTNTYGFRNGYPNQGWGHEMFPNTSRYYAIPILPHAEANVPAHISRRNLSSMISAAAVRGFFDPLYPPIASEAYVVDIDNTLIVLNSNENEDIQQAFRLELGKSGIKAMEGGIRLMNYIVGKREGPGRYWFQANGYVREGHSYSLPTYPTAITFRCDAEPAFTARPAEAVASKVWDKANGTLTVILRHERGAAEFTLGLGETAGLARRLKGSPAADRPALRRVDGRLVRKADRSRVTVPRSAVLFNGKPEKRL